MRLTICWRHRTALHIGQWSLSLLLSARHRPSDATEQGRKLPNPSDRLEVSQHICLTFSQVEESQQLYESVRDGSRPKLTG